MAKKYNDKKMKEYKGSMISEDMTAPGNLPQNVIRRQYGKGYGAKYDYEGNGDAMYRQEMDDMLLMDRKKAKRRY